MYLCSGKLLVIVYYLVGDVSFELRLQLQCHGGDYPEHAEAHFGSVQIRIPASKFSYYGMAFRCACWRDEPHREHVLVHGATFLPERAPVHGVGEDAAKGHAIEEWRNVECEAVGCDAIGKCSHGQATLGMLWPYVVATFTFWLDLTASATVFTISSSVVGALKPRNALVALLGPRSLEDETSKRYRI